MATSRIDLLRHGETTGGACLRGARTDDPLTPAGLAAMRQAVHGMGPWKLIATSPLIRCRAFADALVAELGAELIVDERLREYDFGDWDGGSFETLWREHGDALAAFFGDPDQVTPPNGEAASDFRARVVAAYADLAERGAGDAVLVVAHGGVLRALVAAALALEGPVHRALEWPHAGLTRLHLHAGTARQGAASLAFHAWTGVPA